MIFSFVPGLWVKAYFTHKRHFIYKYKMSRGFIKVVSGGCFVHINKWCYPRSAFTHYPGLMIFSKVDAPLMPSTTATTRSFSTNRVLIQRPKRWFNGRWKSWTHSHIPISLGKKLARSQCHKQFLCIVLLCYAEIKHSDRTSIEILKFFNHKHILK